MKKLFMLFLSVLLIFATMTPATVSAAEDFYLKEFDKAYVTFVFDDCYETLSGKYSGNFFKEALALFKQYNFPMCMAATGENVKVESKRKLLKELETAGGEVLSHTYDHTTITSANSTVDVFEKQLGDSYALISAYGFKVNGIIASGNNGGENTANFELMEPITRKYYKYSNLYGVSSQYDYKKLDGEGIQRRWITNAESTKKIIDQVIEKKEWIVLSAHHFGEIPKSELEAILEYLFQKSMIDKVEVVTWNYIYENFGVYSGPQVPTAEASAKVEQFKKTIVDTDDEDSSATTSTGPQATSSKIVNTTSSKAENTAPSKNQPTSSKIQTSSKVENSSNTDSSTTIGQTVEDDTNTTGTDTNAQCNNKKIDIKILIAVIILVVVLAVCAVAIIFTIKYIKKSNQ